MLHWMYRRNCSFVGNIGYGFPLKHRVISVVLWLTEKGAVLSVIHDDF